MDRQMVSNVPTKHLETLIERPKSLTKGKELEEYIWYSKSLTPIM